MKSKHSDEAWLEAARKKIGAAIHVGAMDYSGDVGEANFVEHRKIIIEDEIEQEVDLDTGAVIGHFIWVTEKEL